MGEVDLNFKPDVPVIDANIALGRRHNRRVKVDTLEGTLKAMAHVGVGRALAYSPHAATFDSRDGNDLLIETIAGDDRILPQFVCNPSYDDMDAFASYVKEHGGRAVRMIPPLHRYPFVDWIVGDWLDWLTGEGLPLLLSIEEVDPVAIYGTLEKHPDLAVVLCEVKYSDATWALPLLRQLQNLHMEISRFVGSGGVDKLMTTVGDQRFLFGSRFPDSQMGAQLYNLHRCGLSTESLTAICAGNLERLLGLG